MKINFSKNILFVRCHYQLKEELKKICTCSFDGSKKMWVISNPDKLTAPQVETIRDIEERSQKIWGKNNIANVFDLDRACLTDFY